MTYRTAEEAMLIAALDDDQAELERLAADAYPNERRTLSQALNRVNNALIAADAVDPRGGEQS